MIILNKIYNFGILIASAIASFFVRSWWRLWLKILPLKGKGIAVGIVDKDARPIIELQEDTLVKLTAAHQALLAALLKLDITPIAEQVNKEVTTAKKIQPCEILDNLPKTYPLGAVNGGATRAQDETVKDEAFGNKWRGSLGVNGYVCQVAYMWAAYSSAYNYIDNLRNTKNCHPMMVISFMAGAIGWLEELNKRLERTRELQPKINVEAWEVLRTSPPIIKRPKKEPFFDNEAEQLTRWAESSKKALEADGIAEAPYFGNDEAQLASWTAIIQTQVQEELTVAAVRV